MDTDSDYVGTLRYYLRCPAGLGVGKRYRVVGASAGAGITKGCNPPNTRFYPDDPVTRGQMAAFLVRAGLTD